MLPATLPALNHEPKFPRPAQIKPRTMGPVLRWGFFDMNTLIPDVLQRGLQPKAIESSIKALGKPLDNKFDLTLEFDIGPELVLQVQEHEQPTANTYRGINFQSRPKTNARAQLSNIYNLSLSALDAPSKVNLWRERLVEEIIINGWPASRKGSFAQDIFVIISQYLQANLKTHQPLRIALEFSIYAHIFSRLSTVSGAFLPKLHTIMRLSPKPRYEWDASKTVNVAIKGLILPHFRNALEQLIRYLENQDTQRDALLWHRDLNICIGFMLVQYIGQTQIHLMQLAEGGQLDPSEAKIAIQKLEEQMPMVRHEETYPSTFGTDESELHAIEFGLMRRIEKIVKGHTRRKPSTLDLDLANPQQFMVHNGGRACWKFTSACIGEKACKPCSLAWLKMKMRLFGCMG